jgi:hypothetical protein
MGSPNLLLCNDNMNSSIDPLVSVVINSYKSSMQPFNNLSSEVLHLLSYAKSSTLLELTLALPDIPEILFTVDAF